MTWLGKIFNKMKALFGGANWLTDLSLALGVAGPALETILEQEGDTAADAVVQKAIAEAQADISTIETLAAGDNVTQNATAIAQIKAAAQDVAANVGLIATAAHLKNPKTVEDAELIAKEINAVIQAIPAPAAGK